VTRRRARIGPGGGAALDFQGGEAGVEHGEFPPHLIEKRLGLIGNILRGRNHLDQARQMRKPLRDHAPEFRAVAANCVGEPRALPHQPFAHRQQHQPRLFVPGLDRDRVNFRARHRDAHGAAVGGVGLAPRNERLHELRRQDLHRVAHLAQRTRPMVGGVRRLEPDRDGCRTFEERHDLRWRERLPQQRLFLRVDPMQLEKALRRIHPNSNNLAHGRLASLSY
jgi:hypothetical protein